MSQTIETKVSGVSFDNRQAIIRTLASGDPVDLVRDSSNAFDSNAIAVLSSSGEMIGYIPKELAAQFARSIDSLGGRLAGEIASVSAASVKQRVLGVRIRFELPG